MSREGRRVEGSARREAVRVEKESREGVREEKERVEKKCE